jgi:hypothetical protein
MKRNRSLLLISAFLFSCGSLPVFGQTITSIELNDSMSAPYWQQWDSMYGTNLPVGSDVTVAIEYVCYNSSLPGYQGICTTDISSASTDPEQTYWYDSSTQINFYAIPYYVPSDTTPTQGCFSDGMCNLTAICADGVYECSSGFDVEYYGTI